MSHLLRQVSVRARQAERKTGADLVDSAAGNARRVCMGTSNSKASATRAQDDLHLTQLALAEHVCGGTAAAHRCEAR